VYKRYHIQTRPAPDIFAMPSRFHVEVKRHRLAELLVKEIFHQRGALRVVASRPCKYGVLSRPLGGFTPNERQCVGCLRCTTESPEVIQIYHNPRRRTLGDSFFTPENIETISYEARTGRVPVKGAGYRGRFGGEGWDGMWTDMSEIVRPTRDGIHGREYISTSVDIGARPAYLSFDGQSPQWSGPLFSLPIPVLFDLLPSSVSGNGQLVAALLKAAELTGALCIMPAGRAKKYAHNSSVVPFFADKDVKRVKTYPGNPALVELSGNNEKLLASARARFPGAVLCLRLDFDKDLDLVSLVQAGATAFHLVANYQGKGKQGEFVGSLIRSQHQSLITAGLREQATLIGTGGIIAAEHIPKAIICGLDAVALDTALLVALQARLDGECTDRLSARFKLPWNLNATWGAQRIANLMASWHDQLLEILGAMGIREVRRLRGESGRAMFQAELEREAFAGIEGYGQ
jgi:hypothetical protein